MKIAVIDDRAEDRRILGGYIEQYMEQKPVDYELVYFESGEQFMKNFTDKKYAMIFLDIYMKEGETDGMKIADLIRKKDSDSAIIFSTTSPDFAIKGYLVKAAGYLLKPYTYGQFAETTDMVYGALQTEKRYIEVKEKKLMVRVLLDKIIYCDYDNHYIRIHTRDRIIRSYIPFQKLREMLLDHRQFLCCYRNIIINMDQVHKMETQDFIMSNDEQIPMRRQDKAELRQRYADYVFDKMNGGRG